MKHQEKKYRVNSFAKIEKILADAGAIKGKAIVTIHYYAQQEGNNVVKLVKYSDRNEIHVLEESKGKFLLKENFPVASIDAGLQWIKDKGFRTINLVKMKSTDYEYKNGVVGLYVIDDFLHSVILDFPKEQHEAVGKELGLATAQVISIPYNKFLEQIGRLRSMKLVGK